MEEGDPDLGGLDDADRKALRLGAEVMAHKALLEGRPRVVEYFRGLEAVLRRQESSADTSPTLAGAPDDQEHALDRQLVSEYLELLVANERLSLELREVVRQLRARHSE